MVLHISLRGEGELMSQGFDTPLVYFSIVFLFDSATFKTTTNDVQARKRVHFRQGTILYRWGFSKAGCTFLDPRR